MMKYYGAFLIGWLLSVSASAQVFGIKAGANVAWTGGDAEGTRPILRYHAGVFSEIAASERICFRPELYYSAQGTGLELEGTARYHYFCLPVLMKIAQEKSYFLLGPQAAVLYEANTRYREEKQNVSAQLNPIDFSLLLGGGIKVNAKAGLELRYHWGISSTSNRKEEHFPNRLLQLSFTYLLTR
jgi:hypothetical protein